MPNQERLRETKHHGAVRFPFNIYPCTIPGDFLQVPLHWHDSMELVYVKKGSGIVQVGVNAYPAEQGDIYIFAPGTLHALHQRGQAVMEYESQAKHPNGVRKGGWYLGPKETSKESVLDPFPYIVQGKTEWLTTISVPVKENNKFLGVSGTDLRLTFLQKMAEEVDAKTYSGKGDVLIVSYDGLIVANSADASMVGKALSNALPNADKVMVNVREGKGYSGLNEGGKSIIAYSPVKLGRSGKFWSVLVKLPRNVVLAEADALENHLGRPRQERCL